MKKIFLAVWLLAGSIYAPAQLTSASLQASGLTCSMCSKAVKDALEKVPFVQKVMVDIKNQTYKISFRENLDADPDALARAVEEAGFSVARMSVTANLGSLPAKDSHIQIGKAYYHFLGDGHKSHAGETSFRIVDKAFVSAKEYRKISALSSMDCVKTGRAAACCTSEAVPENARVYHAML